MSPCEKSDELFAPLRVREVRAFLKGGRWGGGRVRWHRQLLSLPHWGPAPSSGQVSSGLEPDSPPDNASFSPPSLTPFLLSFSPHSTLFSLAPPPNLSCNLHPHWEGGLSYSSSSFSPLPSGVPIPLNLLVLWVILWTGMMADVEFTTLLP